jgi:hypothetical protein
MIKIVDQNVLRNTYVLKQYLLTGGKVALTDYSALESTKGNGLINLRESVNIIKFYPEKVVLLVDTSKAIEISKCSKKEPGNLLIDKKATSKIKEMFLTIQEEDMKVIENTNIANNYFIKRGLDAKEEISNLKKIKQLFASRELQIIREWNEEIDAVVPKIIDYANAKAYEISMDNNYGVPNKRIINWNFIFRFCIGYYILMLNWIFEANFEIEKYSKMLNDIMDLTYSTYGTYFNGLLTNDKKQIKIYNKMLYIINFHKMHHSA